MKYEVVINEYNTMGNGRRKVEVDRVTGPVIDNSGNLLFYTLDNPGSIRAAFSHGKWESVKEVVYG